MISVKQVVAEALAKARALVSGEELRKAITLASGLNVTNYEEGIKNLVPIYRTFFRDRVFRNPNAQGSAIGWKILSDLNTGKQLPYVPEGSRAGAQAQTTADGSASYATWGMEDSYTKQSDQQAYPGVDIEALCIENLAQTFLQADEQAIFQANQAKALGTPVTPTGVAAAGGVSLTAGKYFCKVVALTLDGAQLASSSLATGLTKTQTITPSYGAAYTVNGGLSAMSAASSAVDATTNQKITWSTTAIKGAAKYAWFVSFHASADPGDNSRYLLAITTVNQFVQTSDAAGTEQTLGSLSMSTTDYSTVAIAPAGIFYQAMASASSYFVSADNTVMTMSSGGSIDQIEAAFYWYWNTNRLSPEFVGLSAGMYRDLHYLAYGAGTTKVMFTFSGGDAKAGYALGGTIKGIINPFTGEEVPLVVLDRLPDGMLLYGRFRAPIPGTPSNSTVEVETFGGTWRVDWTPLTLKNEHGMYAFGGVKLYAPQMWGVTANLKRLT